MNNCTQLLNEKFDLVLKISQNYHYQSIQLLLMVAKDFHNILDICSALVNSLQEILQSCAHCLDSAQVLKKHKTRNDKK